MGVLSWELPCTSQCETGHSSISRQGFVAGTSILAFWVGSGGLRVGHALNAARLLTQGSAGYKQWACELGSRHRQHADSSSCAKQSGAEERLCAT